MISKAKILYILGNNLKNKTLITLLLTLTNSTLDLFGIALLIPIITLVTNMEMLLKYEFIVSILESYLGPYNELKYLQFVLILVLFIYFIKSILLTLITGLTGKYTLIIQNELNEAIYLHYLQRPYIQHLTENSSKGINLMCNEVGSFIGHGFQAGLNLINELIIVFVILVFLGFYNFNTTLALLIIIVGICGMFYILSRKPISNISIQRDNFENLKVKNISESLNSIKEIIFYNKINFFYDKFKKINNKCSEFLVKLTQYQQIPKVWIDFITILSLCILIQQSGNNIDDIKTNIAIYVIAAYRLLPSITRILNSIQLLDSVSPIVDKLYINLKLIDYSKNKKSITFSNFESFDLKNINFKFEDSPKVILNNINIKIVSGDFIGIIGPSGSGKTSLLNIISGLLTPTSGDFLINGCKLSKNNNYSFNFISYVSQNNLLLDDTIIKNITLCHLSLDIDWDMLNSVIVKAQLLNTINKFTDGLNQLVGENGCNVSGGEIQRIALARALYQNTPVLILDEPTSALDSDTENNILDIILEYKDIKTIILITHNLKLTTSCNKVYKIENETCELVNFTPEV